MNKARIIITGYMDPDLDATACAISYAEFLQKKGQNAVAALFGSLHREVWYVFKTFNIEKPLDAEKILTEKDKIILVDASDLRGISNKINSYHVIEIIDHRKINEAKKFPNANAQIELVGSCATLIAEKFFKEKINISGNSAALLYSAIISNTVNFQANVTTERDKKICNWLLKFFFMPENYIHSMFAAKSVFNKSLIKILEDDFASFNFNKKHIGIAQLEIVDCDEFIRKNINEIHLVLKQIKKNRNLDLIFLSLIDVENIKNSFIANDEDTETLLEKSLGVNFRNNIAYKKGIMMRKTIVPLVKQALENE